MSIGSKRSADACRCAHRVRRSPQLSRIFVIGLLLAAGCHRTTPSTDTGLQAALAVLDAHDLFALGLSHAATGDLLRAEQYLVAARQRGFHESTAVFWLVRVCVAASRYESALRHASDYLQRHPADWPLGLVVASIHDALGRASRARTELERIVEAIPGESLPHFRLALAYLREEDDRARAHLEAYLLLEPNGAHTVEAKSLLDSDAIEGTPR